MLQFEDITEQQTVPCIRTKLHIFGEMHLIDKAMNTYANGGKCQQLFQVLLIGIKGMHHSSCEGCTASQQARMLSSKGLQPQG